MTRSYVRTHVGLLDDEDYMVLSPLGVAAWHTVNMLQGQQTEDRFKSRAQIVALLRRHGFGGAATEAITVTRSCCTRRKISAVSVLGASTTVPPT